MKDLKRALWEPGDPPGHLAPLEVGRNLGTRVRLCQYDADTCSEAEIAPSELLEQLELSADRVTWIHVEGIEDLELLTQLGSRLQLHPLALEDVVHPKQRPKHEEYEGSHFVVLRSFHTSVRSNTPIEGIENEQLSLFFGDTWVLSIEEAPGNMFAPVRRRLERNTSRLRSRGADYLAYALLDTTIDQFFPVLEALDDHIEALEDEILADPRPEHMERIQDTRRELQSLRRATWPLRDLVTSLQREEHGLIGEETMLHLRDCADHGMQILDRVESYRDLTNSLVDLYMSSVSQRLNEVMKVLTVMAAIFIPLTFIAGIYGMNFDPKAGPYAMPELSWPLGYPMALLTMLAIALAMLGFFRWKRWL